MFVCGSGLKTSLVCSALLPVFVCGNGFTACQPIQSSFHSLKVMLFAPVLNHKGGDRIYEMRCHPGPATHMQKGGTYDRSSN